MDKFFKTIRDNFQNHDSATTKSYLEATSLYADNNVHLLTGLTNARLYLAIDGLSHLAGFQTEIAQTVLCNLLAVLNTIFAKLNYVKRDQQMTGEEGEIRSCLLTMNTDECALEFTQVVNGAPIDCRVLLNEWLDTLTQGDIAMILASGVDIILNGSKEPPAVSFDNTKCTPTTYKELYKVIKNYDN